MLSYRHSFHAGNHADALKHLVQIELLRYLMRKDKRLWYIDTHAGAGSYRLGESGRAERPEYRDGIERLWRAADLPPGIERYVALVRTANRDDQLQLYPGSPAIAQQLLRPSDRSWLFELHPSDYGYLEAEFKRSAKSTRVARQDGFAGLQGLLPPEPRRALIMIDPSYELDDDYTRVIAAMSDARQRFATGCYAIWYPRLIHAAAEQLPDALAAAAGERWLNVSMTVREGRDRHAGLFGSGMFIVNPPHTLPAFLDDTLPRLTELLAQDKTAAFKVDYRIP